MDKRNIAILAAALLSACEQPSETNADVDGSSEAQRRWHISQID